MGGDLAQTGRYDNSCPLIPMSGMSGAPGIRREFSKVELDALSRLLSESEKARLGEYRLRTVGKWLSCSP